MDKGVGRGGGSEPVSGRSRATKFALFFLLSRYIFSISPVSRDIQMAAIHSIVRLSSFDPDQATLCLQTWMQTAARAEIMTESDRDPRQTLSTIPRGPQNTIDFQVLCNSTEAAKQWTNHKHLQN